MDSLFNDYFTNNNNPASLNTNKNQISMKPSQNMNQIYKTNLETSKDVYDFEIKPLKKTEEKTNSNASNSKSTQKVLENNNKSSDINSNKILTNSNRTITNPIKTMTNPNKIEEENPIATQKITMNPVENNIKQQTSNKKINIPQKPTKIIEEILQPNTNETEIILESNEENNTNVPNLEQINLENDKWNDANANSDVLLTGNSEISKDINEILDEDGNLLLYYYDAYEEMQAYPGVVFLFGKVQRFFLFFNKIMQF